MKQLVKDNKLIVIYAAWTCFLIVYAVVFLYSGKSIESLGKRMIDKLIVDIIILHLFVGSVGLYFAWLTQKGRIWGVGLFVVFCLWRLLDALWSLKFLELIINNAPNYMAIVQVSVFPIVWLALIIFAIKIYKMKQSGART